MFFLLFRSDGSVIAHDIKKEYGVLIDPPEFIDHYVFNYANIFSGMDVKPPK